MILVTLAEVKSHLRIVGTAEDAELIRKSDHAEAIVREYLYRADTVWQTTMAAWDDLTVPPQVKAAVLCQAAELYRFRGDQSAGMAPDREHGHLAPQVTAYLHRLRDPAVA